MYTLKAFRGSATFEQTFTNKDAYLDKLSWLQANGFTIGTPDQHAPTSVLSSVKGLVH